MDIKAATKLFGKKFSSGCSAEKNAENMMEISIQGEVMKELGEMCNELYNVCDFGCFDSRFLRSVCT